jgi:hypothetical protein
MCRYLHVPLPFGLCAVAHLQNVRLSIAEWSLWTDIVQLPIAACAVAISLCSLLFGFLRCFCVWHPIAFVTCKVLQRLHVFCHEWGRGLLSSLGSRHVLTCDLCVIFHDLCVSSFTIGAH